jgi:exodeoxyribonuclease VII large subunit
MSSKKPEQFDLFGKPPAPPKPAPPSVPSALEIPPPGEPDYIFDDDPPPLELLDLTGDGIVAVPPVQRKAYAATQQSAPAAAAREPFRERERERPREREEVRVYRVAEILRMAANTLESRYADIWVEGEISNLKAPNHVYFTLKDADAQLPAVMFKSKVERLKFRLTDGLKVRARGQLSLYAQQGKFQMYVEALEPAGLGAQQLAFEQLKKKLEAEGLFDERRKRKLPFLPRRIGIATSATGAAVRDIVRVATRRAPVRLLIANCLVQGEGAPGDIVRAIAALQRQKDVDLIIVGRGGGSAEDLWAFNDEKVARAIASCRVPVISAVGHEVDFTIADFVADKRAATPSQAAELAVQVHADLAHRSQDLQRRLSRAAQRIVGDARRRLDADLGRARLLLQRNMDARRRALKLISERLAQLHPRERLARDRKNLVELQRRLARILPDRVGREHKQLAAMQQRIHAAMQQQLTRRRRAFEGAIGKLDALSPLKVLERGYSLVRTPSGNVVTRASETAVGETLSVTLREGSLTARVEKIDSDEKKS